MKLGSYQLIEKKIQPLFFIILLDQSALSMTVPLLTLIFFSHNHEIMPTHTSTFSNTFLYSVCLSIPNALTIIFSPMISLLSDKIDRKLCLMYCIIGALLFTVSAALGLYLGLLSLFICSALIRGLFTKTNPIALSIVGAISSKDDKFKNMSTLQVAISLGAFIGPIAGGALANLATNYELSYAVIYFIASLIVTLGLLLTFYWSKSRSNIRQLAQPNSIKKIISTLQTPMIRNLSLLLFMTQIGWSLYYQYIPPILKIKFHFSALNIGWFVGFIAVCLTLTTVFITRLFNRYCKMNTILYVGVLSTLLGLTVSLIATTQPTNIFNHIMIWLGVVPTAVGDVLVFTCITTLYSNAVNSKHQGLIQGLCYAIVSMAWCFSGVLGGIFLSNHSVIILGLACSAIGAALPFQRKKANKI